MGDESNGGGMGVALQRGVDIAALVHLHIAESLALEFLPEIVGEDELLRGAGHAVAILCRLCVELRIFQKSLYNVHSLFTFHLSYHVPCENRIFVEVACDFTADDDIGEAWRDASARALGHEILGLDDFACLHIAGEHQ